jgi:hypothetical protein
MQIFVLSKIISKGVFGEDEGGSKIDHPWFYNGLPGGSKIDRRGGSKIDHKLINGI